MKEKFVSIPYVHVYPNLNYYFEFKGERYNVKQKQHGFEHYDETIKDGKKWARRKYYEYYHDLGQLPLIDISQNHNGNFNYSFSWTKTDYKSTKEYTSVEEAFDSALIDLFTTMGLKGVK